MSHWVVRCTRKVTVNLVCIVALVSLYAWSDDARTLSSVEAIVIAWIANILGLYQHMPKRPRSHSIFWH